jgi:hypothetical protein
MYGELYYHKDYTVRQSLQTVLCITAPEAEHLYTLSAMSYKHNAPAPTSATGQDISEMRWSDIQKNFYAIRVNFGGILKDYHELFPKASVVQEYIPSSNYYQYNMTSCNQVDVHQPPPNKEEHSHTKEEVDAANTLLTLKIPQIDDFSKSKTDYPTLSMRWSDVVSGKRRRPSYEEEYDEEEEEDDDTLSNYTVLRNGTLIKKRT